MVNNSCRADCGLWRLGREVFTTSQNVDYGAGHHLTIHTSATHHYLPHLVTWPRWPASADCETVVNWAATDISRIESNNQGREGENFPLPLAADRCIVTCCVRCCQNTHHITSHNTEHGTQGSRQGQCDGFCIVGLCCGMESG